MSMSVTIRHQPMPRDSRGLPPQAGQRRTTPSRPLAPRLRIFLPACLPPTSILPLKGGGDVRGILPLKEHRRQVKAPSPAASRVGGGGGSSGPFPPTRGKSLLIPSPLEGEGQDGRETREEEMGKAPPWQAGVRGALLGVAFLVLFLLITQVSETWAGEGEEKAPLKLPEVVILGQDISVLKEAKERLMPQEVTQALKEVPGEAREKIDLSQVDQREKSAPRVDSPGCLFGNPVTGSLARAILGDEAEYKVGLYRYQTRDYAGAIEAFTRLRKEYPQSAFRAAALYWEGESLFQLGQLDKALATYRQVVQQFPAERLRDYALFSAADVHLRQGQPADAVPLLQELLTRYPTSPSIDRGRRYLAEALFRAGQYGEAAEVYTQLSQAKNGEADRVQALFWRAESFFQQGAFEQAEQGYREFLQADSRSPRAEDALYGLGWAQLNAQKYRTAIETLERLQQMYPQSRFLESALYALVKAHVGLGQIQTAQGVYRGMAQRFPAGKWMQAATIEFAGAAYRAGDYPTATALARQLIEKHPQSSLLPIARVIQADSLYYAGRFAEAIEAYRKAEKEGLSGDILERAWLKRALAAYQLRDFAAAGTELQRFLQKFPASSYAAEAAFWHGESRFYSRQLRQALQAYQQVSPGSSRYPDALYGKGWVYYQGSEWPKAAAEFEQVVRNYPDAPIRPEALYRLGEVQYNLKNFDAALATYQQLRREYPQDKFMASAQFRIGWVKFKTGDTAQAVHELSQVVRQYPRHPVAADARYWLGMAYMSEKQFERARAEFEEVLVLRPGSPLASQALLRLGDTYYNQGKFAQAIEGYRRIADRSTADAYTPDAEYGIILSLYQLRRFNDYATRAKAFSERYPTNPLSVTVLYQVAEVFEADKRPQQALDTYQEVITRFGHSDLVEAAHLRRAELFAAQGNWGAALHDYQAAAGVARSDAAKVDALLGTAKAQYELKQYDAAAGTYRRVVSEFPASRYTAASLRGSARALTQAGRKAEAKQAWQELRDRAPKDPAAVEASLELGLLSQTEGDYHKAIEYFGRVLPQSQPEVAARAQYEIGRSYSLLKNYQQGALELLKVAYLYPEQKRWVQPALFQAAANYEQERKWEEALAIYQKILKEITTREAREQASQKMEQLKKKMSSGA